MNLHGSKARTDRYAKPQPGGGAGHVPGNDVGAVREAPAVADTMSLSSLTLNEVLLVCFSQ